jgi:hypothetical protein
LLLPTLAVGYLSLQVGAYYAGYHPFHGDLGCSPLEEWIVTGLAICAMVLLRDGAPGLAAIAALLSILAFPSGLMFVGLVGCAGLVAGPAETRRDVLRCGFALAAMLLVYAVLLVVAARAAGTFDSMIGEWWAKYFAGRARFAAETPERVLAALGWWALLAGGLPVLGLAAGLVRGDATSRWMSIATLAWVAFFALSPNKTIHYFFPVALLPVAAALRSVVGRAGFVPTLLVPGLLTLSATAAIALCRPRAVAPYVADREFGARSLFLAGSERQAVEFSRVLFHVMDPLWVWKPGRPWTIGHHTWVMYADRGFDTEREYDFCVGQGPPPRPGLTEVTSIPGPDGRPVTFWVRGGRATLREWKARTFPLRTELSRCNFEMPPGARPGAPPAGPEER